MSMTPDIKLEGEASFAEDPGTAEEAAAVVGQGDTGLRRSDELHEIDIITPRHVPVASNSGEDARVLQATEAQLEAERRHTAKLEEELESYRASAGYNLSVLEGNSDAAEPTNVSQVIPVLPLEATLQQRAVFYGKIFLERAREFFMDQQWGAAQITVIYMVLLHYYALFYKRRCF